jgi:NAD(P)-dependent dehydrogenase (short-subunit alcohol dehydrogenase family)
MKTHQHTHGDSTMRDFDGRVALVTGANRGLGLETCRQLLARGLRVVMSGRDVAAVERAARGVGVGGENVLAVRMDVTDPASVDASHRAIRDRFGAVDILVNNAAVLLFEYGEVLSIPRAAYQQTFDTNVFGPVEVCRAFVPGMAERGFGRIVNVSSGAGQLERMSTYAPAYSISKTALNALTRILAAAYRDRGVLANAADPGWVRTDMGGPSAPRSLQEGADTIVWLATLPDDGPTGGFYHDRRAMAW